MDGATGAVAVVSVVGSAGSRRARDSIGREGSIRDVVVNMVPKESPSVALLHIALEITIVRLAGERVGRGGDGRWPFRHGF